VDDLGFIKSLKLSCFAGYAEVLPFMSILGEHIKMISITESPVAAGVTQQHLVILGSEWLY
jgi:hypothetical protein